MKIYVVIANNGWDYEGVIAACRTKEEAEKIPASDSDNWIEEVEILGETE
jgi:hypothetical protein